MQGFIVWFTGLSGSGKSTLAAMLAARLQHLGVHTEVLDGDVVRKNLSKGLGFSKEDRDTNIRRIGFVASLVARSGGCGITAAISPYKAIRDEQRALVDNFVEVHVHCPVEEAIKRDPKGLYKKALAGEIKSFTGIDAPYEEPVDPEVVVNTAEETPKESLEKILGKLAELGLTTGQQKDKGLIAPHGGSLVNRIDPLLEFVEDGQEVELDQRTYNDLAMIAEGAFSPLTGFMNEKDYRKVVHEMRLENGLPWTLPICCCVSPEQAAQIEVGDTVNLSYQGKLVGTLEVNDKFTPDKTEECEKVFRTTDEAHPGVSHVMESGEVYLGGDVWIKDWAPSSKLHYNPVQTRGHFKANKWSKVVAFQTRNPMHRAHEYLTKCALEICDGLLIHPLTGATKEGDLNAQLRVDCIEALIENYYPQGTVMLTEFPAAMRYAGPREAVHHAICRKNYGCSHFIVGRDHAGVGSYYGTYDAQKIFDEFAPGELGITPLCFEHTFYSHAIKGMGSSKTAPGGKETKVFLSGTKVREMLKNGEDLPEEFTRPEVAAILKKAHQDDDSE